MENIWKYACVCLAFLATVPINDLHSGLNSSKDPESPEELVESLRRFTYRALDPGLIESLESVPAGRKFDQKVLGLLKILLQDRGRKYDPPIVNVVIRYYGTQSADLEKSRRVIAGMIRDNYDFMVSLGNEIEVKEGDEMVERRKRLSRQLEIVPRKQAERDLDIEFFERFLEGGLISLAQNASKEDIELFEKFKGCDLQRFAVIGHVALDVVESLRLARAMKAEKAAEGEKVGEEGVDN